MVKLTNFNERRSKELIIDLINKENTTTGYPRYYIGLSGLGGDCLRNLFYTFRWVKKGTINGQTNRIFSVGHKAEETMVADLESVGLECWNVLDDQDEFVAAFGYAKGHPDGYAKGIPGFDKDKEFLLEFKTANDASFKATKKDKVKKAKPVYYAQMILYMHFSGKEKALFMMYNKNNSDYYIEIVDKNEDYAKELVRKAESITFCEDPNKFERIGNNSPNWYACKWCNYVDICFGKEDVEENCRTCEKCNLLGEGVFSCGARGDKHLNLKEQEEGCNSYVTLEGFRK